MLAWLMTAVAAISAVALPIGSAGAAPPYPQSSVIDYISWPEGTLRTAGRGGDIWPVTVGRDGKLYTAWGDGVVGCGRKVSYGVASITGGPSVNLRTLSCGPAGERLGKLGSLVDVDGTLYAAFNVQDKLWPEPAYRIWSTTNGGDTWLKASWSFAGSDLRPRHFVNVGPGHAGALDAYVYLTAQPPRAGDNVYLMRVPRGSLKTKSAYRYFNGTAGAPSWTADDERATPIFTDPGGAGGPVIVRNAALGRFLLTVTHGHAGQLGLFEASNPWGPWRTIAYYERWKDRDSGTYLGVHFPTSWMADGGRTLWTVFSCYGCGEPHHDRFNLVRGNLLMPGSRSSAVAGR